MTTKIGRTKVTSSDCVLPEMMGKYDLVFYTSQRARAIISGSPLLVKNFDKPENHSIIVALEEIRQGELTYEKLMEGLSSPFVDTNKDLEYTDKIYKKEDFIEEEDEDLDYSEDDFEN
jgi:DNA-directed RNA polymerase subunit K/omega